MKYNGKEIIILNHDRYYRGKFGVEFRTKDNSEIEGIPTLGIQHNQKGESYQTYFAEKKNLTEGVLNTERPLKVKDQDSEEVHGYIEKVKNALKKNPGVAVGAIAGLAAGIVNSMGLGYRIHPQDLPDPVLFTAIATAGSATLGGIIQAIKNKMSKVSKMPKEGIVKESFSDKVKKELFQ